jgi:hypothetical protein
MGESIKILNAKNEAEKIFSGAWAAVSRFSLYALGAVTGMPVQPGPDSAKNKARQLAVCWLSFSSNKRLVLLPVQKVAEHL